LGLKNLVGVTRVGGNAEPKVEVVNFPITFFKRTGAKFLDNHEGFLAKKAGSFPVDHLGELQQSNERPR
jgi:hypothetical protein